MIVLAATQVGQFTREEFETAVSKFHQTGKPKIFTFFKQTQIDINQIETSQLESLDSLKARIDEIEHFWSQYRSSKDLILKLRTEFERLI
ncbi:MAG: hypothetical protein AAF564_19725 [Bacteroidota bacterium]